MSAGDGALEAPAATPAVPPRLTFVKSLHGAAAPGRVVDLAAFRHGAPAATAAGLEPVDLAALFADHGETWKERFAQWLGRLNATNASLEWWAHSSTAKNFLSSSLGNAVLEVFAVRHITGGSDLRVYVIGASSVQREAMAVDRARHGIPLLQRLRAAARAIAQFARALPVFVGGRGTVPEAPADVCAITYADRPMTGDEDFYFGALHRHVESQAARRLQYVPYVYAPYRARLAELRGRREYDPLFFRLTLGDWLWALRRAIAAAFRPLPPVDDEPGLELLLQEAFIEDVASRGYLFHLLAYAATKRVIAAKRPRVLLYPYENKSLEKMLVLAGREARPRTQIIGYQHTSITPRHATLLFAESEAAMTPLPDRIITVGELTRDYLQRAGRYPAGLLVGGCALRQQRAAVTPRRAVPRETTRILLALSSSRAELVAGVRFAAGMKHAMPHAEIAVRTHPNFPAALLPEDLTRWLAAEAVDVSRTALTSNLEWCDVTLYASSTVALETLMRGKPVLRFDAGELLSGDPLFLGEPPFRFIAASPAEGAAALTRLNAMDDDEYRRLSHEAVAYALAYLRPYEDHHLALFVGDAAVPAQAQPAAA